MYIVGSGAFLHIMGVNRLQQSKEKTSGQPKPYLEIQTARGMVHSTREEEGFHSGAWHLPLHEVGGQNTLRLVVGTTMR